MKRSGLRALMLGMSLIVVLSLAGMALSVAELESIAGNELVPEISAAAGMALATSYVETKTVAELEEMAVDGRTVGLRTAASNALAILYRDKTEDELTAILTGDADDMVKAAAGEAIQPFLVATTSEEEDFVLADYLKGLAADGESHALRLAAARSYYFVARAGVTAESLEEEAAGDDELAYAAGGALAGFYLSFNPKTQEELEDLAIEGASEGLRVAGGKALATKLIQSDLTAADLQTELLALYGTKTQEYRDAYKMALASRFGS